MKEPWMLSVACLLLIWAVSRAGAEVQVWVPDALEKMLPQTARPAEYDMQADLIAARGEYESIQIALRADQEVKGVTAAISPLEGEAGSISGEDLTLNVVGLIPVEKNTEGTPEEELIPAPCEIPDPLLPYEPLDLEGGRTRAVWITVHVPRDAAPGEYEGTITVRAHQQTEIPVKLTVYPITLPEKRPLHMTNWFDPNALARWYKVEPWSEEHWKLIGTYARDMAEHGEDTIIVSLGLIAIWQEKDGTLTFDFDRFDRYVDTFLKAGIDQGIELGHVGGRGPGGWNAKEMVFHDWKINLREGAEPREFTREEKTRALVRAVQDHLEERGLLDTAMIHIADEPIPVNLESWKEKSHIVHEAAPKLRRVDAIHVPDCGGELEIYCPELGYFDKWYDGFAAMQERGEIELWFYTCCHPTGLYANRFIDYQLIKTRLLHWMNYLYDARGYLHWGPNRWTEQPYQEAVRGDLPPGDAWLVYPGEDGPNSSIRWEALRDGVEDFELLWLLEQEQEALAQRLRLPAGKVDPTEPGKRIARGIIRTLTDYTKSPAELRSAREQVFAAILQARKPPLVAAWAEPRPAGYLAPGPVTVRGAAEQGTTVTVNGQRVRQTAEGEFEASVSVSREQPTVVLIAGLRGEHKRMTWTYDIADAETVLLQEAIAAAEAAGAEAQEGKDLLADHLTILEDGAEVEIEASRAKVRAVIDVLRAAEINALIGGLPAEAKASDLYAQLIEAKRLKDYRGAKELLARLQEALATD